MAVQVIDNFKYAGKKPNFERDQFATVAAMKAYPTFSLDEGHVAYCVETKKTYQYKSSNDNDATLGYWREIVSVYRLKGGIFSVTDSSKIAEVFDNVEVVTLAKLFRDNIVVDAENRVITASLNTNGANCYFQYFHAGRIYRLILKASTTINLDTYVGTQYVDGFLSDNLNTDSASTPLSARQGKVLNEKINTIEGKLGGARITKLPGSIVTLNSADNATVIKIEGVLGTTNVDTLTTIFGEGVVIDSKGLQVSATFDKVSGYHKFKYLYDGQICCLTLGGDDNLAVFMSLNKIDINVIDTLTSYSKTSPLSANAGRLLNLGIDNLETSLKNYINESIIIQ